jgi:ubiquitin carboxyl-terminal hydrolase 7
MAPFLKLGVILGMEPLQSRVNREISLADIIRRVLFFPNGNNVDYVSLYLEHAYAEGNPPEDFSCCVQFGLVVWNPDAPFIYQHHTAHHRFTKEEGDWGFTRFVELRKLYTSPWDDTGRYLLGDNYTANITAYVRIVKDETGVLWHNFNNYDSKKETGFVGLKNQGATCYLNSLIQSLYFTNAFRKVDYNCPEHQMLANLEQGHLPNSYTR